SPACAPMRPSFQPVMTDAVPSGATVNCWSEPGCVHEESNVAWVLHASPRYLTTSESPAFASGPLPGTTAATDSTPGAAAQAVPELMLTVGWTVVLRLTVILQPPTSTAPRLALLAGVEPLPQAAVITASVTAARTPRIRGVWIRTGEGYPVSP